MKSATTASSGTPPPVIRMPVCPVARKVAAMPRAAHLALHGERRVHLADRAVGADREAAPAAAPLAVGDRIAARRHPHVVQLAAVRHRRGDEDRLVAQQVVQARGEVEPVRQRLAQHADPGRRDHPAAVRDADDQRLHPGGRGLGDGHVGQPHVGVAALQAQLADRRVGPPVADALRHLRRQRHRARRRETTGTAARSSAPLRMTPQPSGGAEPPQSVGSSAIFLPFFPSRVGPGSRAAKPRAQARLPLTPARLASPHWRRRLMKQPLHQRLGADLPSLP